MKRSITAVAVVLTMILTLPLFAAAPRMANEVIRMAQAKVGDDSIIAFVQARQGKIEIDADDIIAMWQADVSKAVITSVIDKAATRRDVGRRAVIAAPVYSPYSYDSDPYFYGPTLHGFIGFGGYYRDYGHYGRYGAFGHRGSRGRAWRH